MSHRFAGVWRSALRRASPIRSAATPEDQSLQKTMNLYHRNVPWLFGERGQSLARILASLVALTRRSRSLTRKWTINRTMKWVSRAHLPFFYLKKLICLRLMLPLLFKGEESLSRKSSSRLDYGWCQRQGSDWWKKVEARLVGLVSGETFAAAFLWIKGVIPCCMRKRIWPSDWVVASHLVLLHRKQRSLIKFPHGLAYNQR